MAQVGLHAALGYQLNRIIPYEKRLFPSLIIGSMLPDLDIIIVSIATLFYPISQAESIFHRTFSHSLFTLIFVYLSFSIVSEIKKTPLLKSIGKGITLGMLSHLLIDTLTWFRQIDILWPLPMEPFNLWYFFDAPPLVSQILLIFEFFCFRWYAWFLITKHLNYPNQQSWIIKYLQTWKNWESILFVFFIILALWNPSNLIILFGAAYIPSLIMMLWATYMSRDALESEPIRANNNCN